MWRAIRSSLVRNFSSEPKGGRGLPGSIQQPVKRIPIAISKAPPKPTPGYREENTQDLLVEDWSVSKSKSSSIGKVFNQVGQTQTVYQPSLISPSLALHFKTTESNALLYRQSTHKLLQEIKSLPNYAIALSGKSGTGKSTTLFQIVDHLNTLGWITLYIPKVSRWISGIYPYEGIENSTRYIQPNLVAAILSDFVALNKNQLSKIKMSSGEDMVTFMTKGINNLNISHKILEESLNHLFTQTETRAPLILAVDQANGLYTKTSYCDKNSVPITSDRFVAIRVIYNILCKEVPKNTAILLGNDESTTQIRSYHLNRLIEKAPSLNRDPFLLDVNRYEDLTKTSEFGVELPSHMNSAHKDVFPKGLNEADIPNLHSFTIPVYNLEETRSMLEFLKLKNCFNNIVTEEVAMKQWMISQGNPKELLNSSYSRE